MTRTYNVCYAVRMNEVQSRIISLEENGRTLAAIAREVGVTPDAIGKWKRNERYPRPDKPILTTLDMLLGRKPPKKKLYSKGSRVHTGTDSETHTDTPDCEAHIANQ